MNHGSIAGDSIILDICMLLGFWRPSSLLIDNSAENLLEPTGDCVSLITRFGNEMSCLVIAIYMFLIACIERLFNGPASPWTPFPGPILGGVGCVRRCFDLLRGLIRDALLIIPSFCNFMISEVCQAMITYGSAPTKVSLRQLSCISSSAPLM